MTDPTFLDSEHGFLGPLASAPGALPVWVIPFGLEQTVSYGSGTAKGPAAILRASHGLSTFNPHAWEEQSGCADIKTLCVDKIATPVVSALDQLASMTGAALDAGAFPITLGGEHAITPGALRPFVETWPDIALLHFDAHADLRDGYDGEHYSHAAAIRRCLDHPHVSTVSIGIRNISAEEIPFYEANKHRIHIHWGQDRAAYNIDEILAPLEGKKVYVTIDVDGFDAAVMPATGTPEPGGLFWEDVVSILRAASTRCQWVGADVNELAPAPGLHGCDRLAAMLVWELIKGRAAQP